MGWLLLKPAPAAAAYFPTLLVQPTVSGGTGPGGAPKVGDTLTASLASWANVAGTVTETGQWYRGRDPIAGATTQAAYVVTTADIGCKLQWIGTGTNAKGAIETFSGFTATVLTATAATHKVAFGKRTPSGFGGYPVGVGRTVASGTNMADWTVDDLGDLVPSGTYKAAKTYAANTYLLTLDNAETVSITMIDNRYDVVARQGSASNNDGNYPDYSQLNAVLNNFTDGRKPALGDSIYCRGHRVLNPGAGDVRVEPQSTYSGSGRIRVYGLAAGRLSVDYAYTEVASPLDFVDFNVFNDNAGDGTFSFLFGYTNDGNGIGFYDGYVANSTAKVNPGNTFGLRVRGGSPVKRCRIERVGTGIFLSASPSTDTGDIMWNDFRYIGSDGLQGQCRGTAFQIADNFFRDSRTQVGDHGDGFQHLGWVDGSAHTFGGFRRNIFIRGTGTPGVPDIQGFFATDMGTGVTITGAVIENNIFLHTLRNSIFLDKFINPLVRSNLSLWDFNSDHGGSNDGTIIQAFSGTGGTFDHNVSNNSIATDNAGQSGVTNGTHTQIAMNDTANNAAFNAFNRNPASRAEAIAAFTPKLNGSLKKGDGSYDGPLLPPTTGTNYGCWSSREAYA